MVPAPVAEPAHVRHALPADIAGEQRAKPAPPYPPRLVAQVNPTLEQKVLDVSQAEGIFDVHHHHEADYLQ